MYTGQRQSFSILILHDIVLAPTNTTAFVPGGDCMETHFSILHQNPNNLGAKPETCVCDNSAVCNAGLDSHFDSGVETQV